jgi:hypothetical protein
MSNHIISMQINLTIISNKTASTWAQVSSSAKAGASSSKVEYHQWSKYQYQWPDESASRPLVDFGVLNDSLIQ